MKEHIEQLNHLAEVLYNESHNLDTVSKGKAKLYQNIVDEIQENLDSIKSRIIIFMAVYLLRYAGGRR